MRVNGYVLDLTDDQAFALTVSAAALTAAGIVLVAPGVPSELAGPALTWFSGARLTPGSLPDGPGLRFNQ